MPQPELKQRISECSSSNNSGASSAAASIEPEDKESSFLPLVISQNREEETPELPLIDLLDNTHELESIVTDDNGPDTVIPLITELGVKDG